MAEKSLFQPCFETRLSITFADLLLLEELMHLEVSMKPIETQYPWRLKPDLLHSISGCVGFWLSMAKSTGKRVQDCYDMLGAKGSKNTIQLQYHIYHLGIPHCRLTNSFLLSSMLGFSGPNPLVCQCSRKSRVQPLSLTSIPTCHRRITHYSEHSKAAETSWNIKDDKKTPKKRPRTTTTTMLAAM